MYFWSILNTIFGERNINHLVLPNQSNYEISQGPKETETTKILSSNNKKVVKRKELRKPKTQGNLHITVSRHPTDFQ